MSATGVDQLNAKWEALSERFNLLQDVPSNQATVINAAISEWQDWYWGSYGAWPDEDLINWQERYLKAAALLDAVAKQTVTVSTVQQTSAYTAPGVAGNVYGGELPPLLVTAPVYRAPAAVVYQEQPITDYSAATEAPRYTLDMGPAVASWGAPEASSLTTYDIEPGTSAWVPTVIGGRPTRAGLAALVVSVAAAVLGKKQGWL